MAGTIAAMADMTFTFSRQGDLALASLFNSTQFIDLTAFAWASNIMQVQLPDTAAHH